MSRSKPDTSAADARRSEDRVPNPHKASGKEDDTVISAGCTTDTASGAVAESGCSSDSGGSGKTKTGLGAPHRGADS